jgi:hypothetical protein
MPKYDVTLGDEVADLATLAGFAPDPEQRVALDMLFALNRRGTAAVRDLAVCAPRQNLKTGFLKQAALGWLFITEQRLVVWSAHEFPTSQEAFRDMTRLIESCPDLDREVKQIHYGNGEEAIELTGDRRLKFRARTKSGGRGLTGDKIVLDEAMYLKDAHMGALVPTLRAVKDPQLVLAGSAGMVESAVWRSYRDRGRAGGDPSLGFIEFCDPKPGGCAHEPCSHAVGVEGCALDDRSRWWSCNTALGRRITEETLASDRRSLPPPEFARETLGWWEDPPVGSAIFDLLAWHDMADKKATLLDPVTFSVEIPLDRSRAFIGSAGPSSNGRTQVEIAHVAGGTEWVVPWLERNRGPVVVDGGNEAASLIPAMEKAGLKVHKVNGAERAQACGTFFDHAQQRRLSHLDDPEVTAAMASAAWRESEGARSFSRRRSAGDIAALYAVTLALHGMTSGTSGPSVYEERGLVTL